MRGPGSRAHRRAVRRVLVDIGRDGDGRVVGQVTRLGRAPERFTGWLELLHLLEDHADGMTTQKERTDT